MKLRERSLLKRGAVAGGILGFAVTAAPLVLGLIGGGIYSAFLWMLTVYPTRLLYRWCGWKWVLQSTAENNSTQITCVGFAVNVVLFTIVGALLGLVSQWVQLRKQTQSHGSTK